MKSCTSFTRYSENENILSTEKSKARFCFMEIQITSLGYLEWQSFKANVFYSKLASRKNSHGHDISRYRERPMTGNLVMK